MMSATDPNDTNFHRDTLRDGSKVKIIIAGQAPRQLELDERFDPSPRSTSFDAYLKLEHEGSECPDLDTFRGIGRAVYHALKGIEAHLKTLGTATKPIYASLEPKFHVAPAASQTASGSTTGSAQDVAFTPHPLREAVESNHKEMMSKLEECIVLLKSRQG
jgi:hypothetical protein